MKNKLKRLPLAMGLAGILTGYSLGAGAAGFALIEQSASGLGNAFAGGAASAEDASTIFYNPAGLTLVQGRQLVVGLHAIRPSAKFNNQGSTTVGGPLTGGNGGDAGDWGFVPNLYYAMDISPGFKFGLGINAPFGLKTQYNAGWVGRYQAQKSEVKTVNINPALAYKVNDTVSLGAGISAQYIRAELTKAIDFSTVCLGTLGPGPCTALGLNVPQTRDGAVKLTASDWSYGFNLGALFQVNPATRIGLAYRSKVRQKLSGDAGYSNVPAAFAASPTFTNTGAKANITLPDSLSLSALHQVDSKWAIMGDVTWTRWSEFNELRIRFDNGAADNVTPENWRDTYRVSLGTTYQYNDAWKIRGGIAYDRTPVTDAFRTARIPDNDRTWLAVGASYKVSKAGSADFGYAHLFVKDASINKTEPAAGNLLGNYSNDVNILSVQYTHNF